MSDSNPVQIQIEQASSQPDETILKQKPPRKPRAPLAPEVKAKLAANMKKVNEARIAAAKIKNEHKLNAKQAEIAKEAADRLEVIEKKKEAIAKLKASSPPLEPKTPKPKKSKKQVILEVSDDSDSTDSETDGEDEPEILYVAKKQTRTRAKSDPSIVKPKKQNKPQTPPQQEDSRPIIKFV
jgi:hypothetical protein